jgi:hypothetical protein
MVASTNIGTIVGAGAVNPSGQEQQSDNTYFNQFSTSTTSHKLLVHQLPIVLRAFNLASGDTVNVMMSTETATGEVLTQLYVKGKQVQLTHTNNCLVLDLSGQYRLVLNAAVPGSVTVVGHETPISYWSYGLAAFAQ